MARDLSVLHREKVSNKDTMEIRWRFTLPGNDQDDEKALVFITKSEFGSFYVFESIAPLLSQARSGTSVGGGYGYCFSTDSEAELVAYLSGAHAIGAWAVLRNLDGTSFTGMRYFSFDGCHEDNEEETEDDAFGVPDNEIFYYCADAEAEMDELKEKTFDFNYGFKVISYKLVYTNPFQGVGYRTGNCNV